MCKSCETKPVYEFINKRKVCKNCFIKYFHKKFLYTIRKFNMIKKNDKIIISKKKDFRNIVMNHLLEKFFQDRLSKKGNTITIASTIDSETEEFLENLTENTFAKIQKKKNEIRPIHLFRDKEILLYARLINLKFNKRKKKKEKNLSKFLDELEKKHPEIKWSVMKSYSKLFN